MASGAAQAVPGRSRLFLGALAAMSLLAWLALWQAGASPYAHYIHHAHRHEVPGSGWVAPGAIFVAGWTVMSVAMMLPTSLPLLSLFALVTRMRQDRAVLLALVCAGYLFAWMGAGGIAYGLAVAFREAAAAVDWLGSNPWAAGTAVCLAAGAFQFSSLKYACLDRCRSPFSFVNEHWTGTDARRDALRLGWRHGLFCVGCCWALMLLMIPLGAGNLLWMLVLGAAMAIEKNVSWGRRLVKPLGFVLIATGLAIAARGLA